MSDDEFEKVARKKAASLLQLNRAKSIGLGLRRFSSYSFIQGALFAMDYLKSKERERAQAECVPVIHPPTKQVD